MRYFYASGIVELAPLAAAVDYQSGNFISIIQTSAAMSICRQQTDVAASLAVTVDATDNEGSLGGLQFNKCSLDLVEKYGGVFNVIGVNVGELF